MAYADFLVQTCTIRRGVPTDGRYGHNSTIDWNSIATVIPCRLDFTHQFQSRLDIVAEEYVGRNEGRLFLEANVDIRARDLIILDNPDSEPYEHAYDVENVEPVLDLYGLHHLEVTVTLRQNFVLE